MKIIDPSSDTGGDPRREQPEPLNVLWQKAWDSAKDIDSPSGALLRQSLLAAPGAPADPRRVNLAESLNRLHLTGDTTGSRRQSLVHHALVGDLLSLAECLVVEVAQ